MLFPIFHINHILYHIKGQSIPRGLHVRLNLQTGKKEAKLMEEDSKNLDSVSTNTKTGQI